MRDERGLRDRLPHSCRAVGEHRLTMCDQDALYRKLVQIRKPTKERFLILIVHEHVELSACAAEHVTGDESPVIADEEECLVLLLSCRKQRLNTLLEERASSSGQGSSTAPAEVPRRSLRTARQPRAYREHATVP